MTAMKGLWGKQPPTINADDGRPRATGNVDESINHHGVELRSPLSKAPLFVVLIIEREQLSNVSELLSERRLLTYIAMVIEICDIPPNALGDFLE